MRQIRVCKLTDWNMLNNKIIDAECSSLSDVCVFSQPGQSGKTIPELEKTVGLMKKVVERLQRENETLKKSSAPANQTKMAALQQENLRLKVQHHL